jgi:glycosyltransferase involved in cell wall biosynthesis
MEGSIKPYRPVRVLHVFGAMDRGGAETRTLEILRRLDASRYAFDFCVLSGTPGAYAAEIEARGGCIVRCALRPHPARFIARFVRVLRRSRYDVVHSHVHHFSGVILAASRLAGVPRRVAHIRSTDDGRPTTPLRRAYRVSMRRLIDATATTVIGVSEGAMEAFFGPRWRRDRRRTVVYNGVEPARFSSPGATVEVRREFGLPAGAPLLLHVGRFDPQKNHAALVALAEALVARRPDAVFILVGDGVLRERIEREVAERGLGPRFRFAGLRDDVPRLLAAADLLICPSLWEGLPGVVLEAAAAGVPVVASELPGVVEIARRTPGIVTADPARPEAFAAIVDALLAPAVPERPRLPDVFTTRVSMEQLLACYE